MDASQAKSKCTVVGAAAAEAATSAAISPATIMQIDAAVNTAKDQEKKLLPKEGNKGLVSPAPPIATELFDKAHSDCDDAPTTMPPAAPARVTKKRRTLGGAEDGEDRIRLKRRKIKVAGAPKMPLTGYVRYMNDRRENLKKEYPSKTAIEHTKIIGEEWSQLSEERKVPYMKAAEIDKERYLGELHIFLKARPDVLASELAKNKKPTKNDDKTATTATTSSGSITAHAVLKEKSQLNGGGSAPKAAKDAVAAAASKDKKDNMSSPPAQQQQPKAKRTPTPTVQVVAPGAGPTNAAAPVVPGEIPIFTNDFLENNKSFDLELRTLRKTKADLEQQNAVLEKHVENMKCGVEKLSNENKELEEKNHYFEVYLENVKRKLVHALADLAIPGEPHGATVDNIDKYMEDLYKMATTNTHGPASFNKAKDIIRKLELHVHL